jgi:hypothetical protein
MTRCKKRALFQFAFKALPSLAASSAHRLSVRIHEKFIVNSGEIAVSENAILVKLKKKKNLPLRLTIMNKHAHQKYPWADNKSLTFEGLTNS